MKNKGYTKLGGGGAQISCIMGDVQVAYCKSLHCLNLGIELHV